MSMILLLYKVFIGGQGDRKIISFNVISTTVKNCLNPMIVIQIAI